MENKSVKTVLHIQGKEYTISTNESEEFVQRVAYYVDKKFEETASRNKRLSTILIALFSALNIAEDYLKTLDENKKLSAIMQEISSQDERKTAEIDMLRNKNEAYMQEIQRLKIQIAKLER